MTSILSSHILRKEDKFWAMRESEEKMSTEIAMIPMVVIFRNRLLRIF